MKDKSADLKIGTVGTSSIMELIQDAFRQTEGMMCTVVYSRNEETGRRFAEKAGVPDVCTDYTELIGRDDLDIIYIASPNRFHAQQAAAALERGKHVIVEKPMAVTGEEADRLTALAEENGVFILEAVSTLFMPHYRKVQELLPQIGSVREAVIRYGQYSSKYDAYVRGENPNIFNPEMQAGALNDMGIYGVHAAIGLFGAPQKVSYTQETGPNGIDLAGVLEMQYPDFVCRVETAKNRNLENGIFLTGENGRIAAGGALNGMPEFRAEIEGREYGPEPDQAENRLVYEQARFAAALKDRDTDFFKKMAVQSRAASKVLEEAHASAVSLLRE